MKVNLICKDIPECRYSHGPNEYEFWGEYMSNKVEAVIQYLSDDTASINRVSINDEINEKSFFLIDISRIPFDILTSFFKEDNDFINILILLSKNENVSFVFTDLHEICNIDSINKFVSLILEMGFSKDRIHIINNDSILHKNCILKNIYKTHQLPTTFGKGYISANTRHVINKTGKFFLCHNRTPKFHRLAVVSYLRNLGILEDVNYSFLEKLNEQLLKKYENIEEFFHLKEDFEYINSVKKYSDGESADNSDPDFDFQNVITPTEYEKSYINITTESNFHEKSVHITEKSFKPFAFYQIPIIVAGYKHNYYLKKEYGFDLYEDLVNLSFDNEPDDTKRLLMIFDELKRLHDNKESVELFYKENYKRFINNRKLLKSIIDEYRDLETFKKIFL